MLSGTPRPGKGRGLEPHPRFRHRGNIDLSASAVDGAGVDAAPAPAFTRGHDLPQARKQPLADPGSPHETRTIACLRSPHADIPSMAGPALHPLQGHPALAHREVFSVTFGTPPVFQLRIPVLGAIPARSAQDNLRIDMDGRTDRACGGTRRPRTPRSRRLFLLPSRPPPGTRVAHGGSTVVPASAPAPRPASRAHEYERHDTPFAEIRRSTDALDPPRALPSRSFIPSSPSPSDPVPARLSFHPSSLSCTASVRPRTSTSALAGLRPQITIPSTVRPPSSLTHARPCARYSTYAYTGDYTVQGQEEGYDAPVVCAGAGFVRGVARLRTRAGGEELLPIAPTNPFARSLGLAAAAPPCIGCRCVRVVPPPTLPVARASDEALFLHPPRHALRLGVRLCVAILSLCSALLVPGTSSRVTLN
ncbi:hypothetical protein DFH07DRAFT_963290 [Mycena maculata]|uniref:Uncharacterized protein n=1 Tax=Mycena maculata TaxID=230809 RepID=A0AAD7N5R5_9AGAR|nr:hypothetical protein DFH07DRAFT_963290 [Mycena maculata]